MEDNLQTTNFHYEQFSYDLEMISKTKNGHCTDGLIPGLANGGRVFGCDLLYNLITKCDKWEKNCHLPYYLDSRITFSFQLLTDQGNISLTINKTAPHGHTKIAVLQFVVCK